MTLNESDYQLASKIKCEELDRLDAVATEAAKRIRNMLELRSMLWLRHVCESDFSKCRTALNDLEDIAERIERRLSV